MTFKNISDYGACIPGLERAQEFKSYREWFLNSDDEDDVQWFLKQALYKAPHKDVITLAVEFAKTVYDKMPIESQKVMDDLDRHLKGETVDLIDLRKRAYAAALASAWAEAAAYAAWAADATATAAYAAAASKSVKINVLDLIRSKVTVDKLCGYLNLDPDGVIR